MKPAGYIRRGSGISGPGIDKAGQLKVGWNDGCYPHREREPCTVGGYARYGGLVTQRSLSAFSPICQGKMFR